MLQAWGERHSIKQLRTKETPLDHGASEPFQDGSAGRLNIRWRYTNRISQHYMGNSCFWVLFCAVHLNRLTECIFHIKTLFVSADLKLIRFKKVDMLLNNPCSSQNCMMRAKMNELFNPFSFTNLKHQGQIFCCSVTFKKFIRWVMFLSKKPHNPSKRRLCLLFRTPLSSLVTSWCLQSGVLEDGQTWICKDKFHVGCKEIKWYLPNAALTLCPVPALGSAPGEPGMAHTLLSLPSCSSLKQTPQNSQVL